MSLADKQIKVFITDDHQLFRTGVKMSLASKEGIEIIGEAVHGLDLLNQLIHVQPDIILLGISMPVMDGVTTLPVLKERYPHIKIIMLTMHNDPDMICRVIELGANAYLTKESGAEKIYEAILACYKSWFFINETLINAFITRKIQITPGSSHGFNSKELLILKCLHNGKTTKEIVEDVELSSRTVDALISRLKTKTSSNSLEELIEYALRNKLIE